MDAKICNGCRKEKSVSEFYWSRGRPRSVCKLCWGERNSSAHTESRDDRVLYMRRRDLRVKYGITIEEYEALFDAQKGVCAICKQAEKTKGRTGEARCLSVDHDHETLEVRGLLCHFCNSLIGLAREDTEILSAARDYIMRRAKVMAEQAY